MARSVYARAAARGFPALDREGQTGMGRLQSWGGGVLGWQPHGPAPFPWEHGPTGQGTRGYDLAAGVSSRTFGTAAEMGETGLEWVQDAPLWGLAGGTRPDELPRTETPDAEPAGPRLPASGHLFFEQYDGGLAVPTHAAPFPNRPMSSPYNHEQESLYWEEENEVHGVSYGGYAQRTGQFGFFPQLHDWTHEPENSPGGSNLQPLSGPIRAQAGLDPVQGYGGGGRGPGGLNATRQFGYWRDEQRQGADIRPVIVSAGEIPFVTELPQMFTATDATTIGQPVTYGYNAPTVQVAGPQAPYEVPPVARGVPLPAGPPAYAGSFWS